MNERWTKCPQCMYKSQYDIVTVPRFYGLEWGTLFLVRCPNCQLIWCDPAERPITVVLRYECPYCSYSHICQDYSEEPPWCLKHRSPLVFTE